jgi:glyoxylase-like metal-dependent hydrolase (beta-lactamase superfamily II)
VYITEIDRTYLCKVLAGETGKGLRVRFQAEGFPEDLITLIETTSPARIQALERVDDHFYGLSDEEEIHVGIYRLRTILVPGHTPGCAMFWMEDQKTMFTGDHLLFDITPNITTWIGIEDALSNYLDSLGKSKGYPVKRALPGHREPGKYQERIEKLLAHHERRITQALEVISANPGLSAYEIAERMTWKIRARNWDAFPTVQKWFAVGECLSHLDYLRKRGKITRLMADGIYRYSSEIA